MCVAIQARTSDPTPSKALVRKGINMTFTRATCSLGCQGAALFDTRNYSGQKVFTSAPPCLFSHCAGWVKGQVEWKRLHVGTWTSVFSECRPQLGPGTSWFYVSIKHMHGDIKEVSVSPSWLRLCSAHCLGRGWAMVKPLFDSKDLYFRIVDVSSLNIPKNIGGHPKQIILLNHGFSWILFKLFISIW